MRRTLFGLLGLVLDPQLTLIAVGLAVAAWGMSPDAVGDQMHGLDEWGYFTGRDIPEIEAVAPPVIELVRHADVPGCPGCKPGRGPCLAALPPL